MDFKLLQTKLNRPLLRDDLLHRDRLLDILERSVNHRLVLVSAPAGYGKSVLINQWLESHQEPSTWLSLDAEDNNLVFFLEYVVAAVQRLFPKACSVTQALLGLPVSTLTTALSNSLINELDAIDAPFILVLDDYHRIHEPAVHDLLSQLLRYPPRSLKLVILTRRDPPLPLTNLRAQGKMTEIRLQDLRFTPRETSNFLERTLNCRLGEEVLTYLEDHLEGWAVGIRLLSLVLPYQTEPDKFLTTLNGQLSSVLDYLVEEVLDTQSAAVRECLKQTAILERFCPPLVETLCKLDNSISLSQSDMLTVLKTLKAGNLLIIPLTEDGDWSRYHHLFQRLLRKQLKCDYSPEEIAALHKRASEWFEAHNLLEEAINHALKAGDTIEAAQIVERHRMAEMNADRWHRLDHWLSKLPEAFIQQRSQLLLCQGWILYFRYRLTEIPAIIEQVEKGFTDEALEPTLLSELNILNGIIYFWKGWGERSLEFFEKGQKHLPETAHFIRAETELYLGLTRYIIGQKHKAIKVLNHKLCQLSLREFSSKFGCGQK